MEIKVGNTVWDKETKQKFEIIYLDASDDHSIVLITKGSSDRRTVFIRPKLLEADFTDVNPKQWVYSIDVVGNIYGFEYYDDISSARVYPTRDAAERARDKECLLVELQEYADVLNDGWSRLEEGKFVNFGYIIHKSVNDCFIPVMSGNQRFVGDIPFLSWEYAQKAIEYFDDRLELLFE